VTGRTLRHGLPAAVLLAAMVASGALGAGGAGGAGSAPGSEVSGGENARRIGLSLLLPGAAQLRMGEGHRAVAFLVAEAATWTAWAVFRTQGALRKDSYVEMAELDAGVLRAGGRDDAYYRLLGNWSSSNSYDQLIRREARDLYGDDLQGRAAYFEANRTPADRAWRWKTLASWDRYSAKRNDSRKAYRSARMMLGLAAANRVVAMVDASLLASRRGRNTGLRLQAIPGPDLGSAAVGLSLQLP
jgi:hypothetical protein